MEKYRVGGGGKDAFLIRSGGSLASQNNWMDLCHTKQRLGFKFSTDFCQLEALGNFKLCLVHED